MMHKYDLGTDNCAFVPSKPGIKSGLHEKCWMCAAIEGCISNLESAVGEIPVLKARQQARRMLQTLDMGHPMQGRLVKLINRY